MALRQTKKVTIDGHEYQIRQLGALEGRRLWFKLAQTLAASLKGLTALPKLDEAALATAVATVLERLDEGTLEELYEAFGKNCQLREGERWPDLNGVIFDEHFAGRYLSMSKWMGECLVFNFGGFFEGMSLGKVTDLVQKAAGKPVSLTGSTGSSTESSPTNAHP